MIVEVIVSEASRLDVANALREIAIAIEREINAVTHWGGHHGKAGSYSVTITDPEAIRDDL